MKKVFILQGSNEGNRLEVLNLSLIEMEKRVGKMRKVSSIYESEPWGFIANQWFLNRVILLETTLDPMEILKTLLEIELEFGRKRMDDGVFHSRTLDLDILFIDNLIYTSPDLTIPHPQIQNRKFTLLPLAEIDSNLTHPILKKSMEELLLECKDSSQIKRTNELKENG